MGEAGDASLMARARGLLATDQQQHPSLSAELLDTAIACHSRMLDRAEQNRPAAVELAIAGADLLQALQRHSSAEAIPDWVPIHEEQCCRYGALWIDDLLQQGQPLSQEWGRRALALLQRLQELHAEPVPWIELVQGNLQAHLNSTTASSSASSSADLRLVIVGNCQAHPLMLSLRRALPGAAIHFCPSVHLATPADVARLHGRLASADLLVMHRVQPGYRDGIGLDTPTLRNLLPPTGTAQVLPNLHYEGHHPWIGYAQDPDGKLAGIQPESPLGDYHDFLAMVAVAQGLSPRHLLCRPCPGPLASLLQGAHQTSLSELRRREADCDVGISDWISAEHRRRPLVHTINHPTQALLHALLQRLLVQLGWGQAWDPQRLDHQEHLGSLSIPIHPWVSEALQLEGWSGSWGQRQGSPWAIEEQLEASMAFYQRHPWILAANASHPKAIWAAQLLASIEDPIGSPNGLAPRPPRQAPAESVPIPYAFLDPRHAFQAPDGQTSAPGAPPPSWDRTLHTYRIGWRLEPQARVLPTGVITQQGWLSDCLQYLPPGWTQLDWMRSMAGFALVGDGDRVGLIEQTPVPTQHLPGRWCVLNDIVAHRNLGHFFFDLLPQLIAIRRLRQQWPDLQVLGTAERHPNLQVLRELLLDGCWQSRPAHQRLQVDELILQPLAFNGGIGFLAKPEEHWWFAVDDLRDGLHWLRQRLAPDPAALWRGHWLCFSRDLAVATEAPQGRTFSNHAQLLEQLSNAGVLIIDPGRHDIRQLQLLVAAARGFVGIHGAGLFNALLGPAGARVLEIRPACGCSRTVEFLCRSVGLDWQPIACERDPLDSERSVIPIDAVLALLE
jgi:hypothetical protein